MAVGFLLVMVMLTVTDVFLRTVFDRTIVYMYEFTEYTMLVVVYFGLSWCALTGKHLKADLIVRMFPEKAQDYQDAINNFIVICVSAVVAVRVGVRAGICMMEVPTRIRCVCAATQVMVVTASEP